MNFFSGCKPKHRKTFTHLYTEKSFIHKPSSHALIVNFPDISMIIYYCLMRRLQLFACPFGTLHPASTKWRLLSFVSFFTHFDAILKFALKKLETGQETLLGSAIAIHRFRSVRHGMLATILSKEAFLPLLCKFNLVFFFFFGKTNLV